MIRDHTIAVVMPAHNEVRLIERSVAAVPEFVDAIVVVDDASVDGTAAAVARAAARDARVVPIGHDENRGVGAAIVTGFRAALRRGADVVVVMDGDGQMHPEDLPALIEPICGGRADVAKGNRFDGFRPRGNMPVERIAGNLVLSVLTRVAAGWRGPLDAQCGYIAIRASALARLPLEELYPRYGFPNDLLLRALDAALRVVSVPIRAVYGAEVSGIRLHVAVPRIVVLLWRGFVRRRLQPGFPVRAASAEADEA